MIDSADVTAFWYAAKNRVFFSRFHVPVAFYVMMSAGNLLLVVNSSINFVVYCLVGRRFRAELKAVLTAMCRSIN